MSVRSPGQHLQETKFQQEENIPRLCPVLPSQYPQPVTIVGRFVPSGAFHSISFFFVGPYRFSNPLVEAAVGCIIGAELRGIRGEGKGEGEGGGGGECILAAIGWTMYRETLSNQRVK